jgi:3-hydroxyisobutyrate dehydrogenase-like beta-hydroxyacid dehydrogenase
MSNSPDYEGTMSAGIVTPTIGFVGLGRMGGPMSRRLIDAGFSLCVFDTSADALAALRDAGSAIAASPEDVGDSADIVFVSLPTPDIVEQVVLSGVGRGSRAKIIVDLSTSGPGMAGRVSRGLEPRGIAWIDAPVSGGIAGAKGGALAVMASGPRAAFETVEPLLKNFGKVFFVGEKAGLAQVAKLGNNLLAAAAMVISSEALVMGVKAGIDPKIMLDIINAGSGRNSATQDKFPRSVLTRTFDFGFATGLSYKDVRLCVDEAESLGVPMVVGAAVRQMLAVTNAKFGASSDFTSITRVVEEWAGVEVKG